MTKKNWTNAEVATAIALRIQGLPWAEIGDRIGRSESSIWVKFSGLGIKLTASGRDEAAQRDHLEQLHRDFLEKAEQEAAPTAAGAPEADSAAEKAKTWADTTVEEDLEEMRRRVALADAKASTRKYQEVLGQKVLEDRLVDVFRERVVPFIPPVPNLPPSSRVLSKISTRPESAVLVISDTHIGQVVSVSQTNGFGGYNPRIYCERLYYMQEKVTEILSETAHGCDELVVLLLGDIIHGALDHGAEREDHAVVVDQFQLALWSLHQFLGNLALRVPKMRIYTVVGNHGRFPNQRKMPTTNRYSNFDHIVYAALQLTLGIQGLRNIDFVLNDCPRQLVEIKGSRFSCHHGDTIRGGDKQFGIPIHNLTRDVNATLQRFAAHDEKPVDYFVMGDKHKAISLPLGRGEYIVNGSMVGPDEYSMVFCPAEPTQLLFGVDQKLRKTWSHYIKVAHAPALQACPYLLPAQIRYLVEEDDQGSLAA